MEHSKPLTSDGDVPELMRALVFDVDAKMSTLEYVPTPRDLSSTQVLVKVCCVGICGSDLHVMKGDFPVKRGGHILGHEISGIVAAVGSDVSDVHVGDRVGIEPNRECGLCTYCARNKPQFCRRLGIRKNTGLGLDGGFADFVRVEDVQVHRLPDGISLDQGFLAETMSCVFHGRELVGQLDPDAKIAILGAGMVGVLFTSLLHHQGHRDIVVTEPSDVRRLALLRLGLPGVTILSPEEAAVDIDLIVRDPDGSIDLVVDCCGVSRAVQSAVPWLKHGGTLLVFACPSPSETLSLNLLEVSTKELRIIGTHINPRTYTRTLGLMQAMGNRYFDLKTLGVKAYALPHFQECFVDDSAAGKVIKAYFDLQM